MDLLVYLLWLSREGLYIRFFLGEIFLLGQ